MIESNNIPDPLTIKDTLYNWKSVFSFESAYPQFDRYPGRYPGLWTVGVKAVIDKKLTTFYMKDFYDTHKHAQEIFSVLKTLAENTKDFAVDKNLIFIMED